METYTAPKQFLHLPGFHALRQKALSRLDMSAIDAPIADLMRLIARLPHCFTLQSRYGHLHQLFRGQQAIANCTG